MTPLPRCLALSVAAFALLLGGCAHNVEVHEPTPSQDSPPPPPPPPTSSVAAAQAQSVTVDDAPRGDCAIRCIAASGARPVDGELEQQIGAALTPTLDAMRACVRQAGIRTSYSPMMTLRFGASGQLSSVGVDTAGFEAGEPCVSNAAFSGTPSVTMTARAVLRCHEQCTRHGR